MSNITVDIDFVCTILPDHYEVRESKTPGSIHCVSNIGIRKTPYLSKSTGNMITDAEDDEHWGYIMQAIISHFGPRFQEVDHNTCFCHIDFTIYLKVKKLVLKSITEPTDVYVLGCYVSGIKEVFKVDDDYTSFSITNGHNIDHLDTSGHVFILTREELEKIEKKDITFRGESNENILKLSNFCGDILLNVVSIKTHEAYDEFDIDDYILHQVPEDNDWSILVVIPENTDINNTMFLSDLFDDLGK
jgi:hypothetical protein